MKRTAHKMKAGVSTSMPKYVIFFDTETIENIVNPTTRRLSLKLGVAVATRYQKGVGLVEYERCEFTDRDTFLRWIDTVVKGREQFYITAHNIAFDVRIVKLLQFLHSKKWRRTFFVCEGINFIARYRKGSTTIKIVNNMQLFNVSLRALGDSIGIPKLEVDFAVVSDADLLVYCRRDVEVMVRAWNIWLGFLTSNDLGSFKITAASTALSAFKHRFMQAEVFVHTHDPTIALERASYHGGRVECFFQGRYEKGVCYALDVNSMYPSVMATTPVPVKLRRYYDSMPLAHFERIRHESGYIVEAKVELFEPSLPKVSENRLIFPVGRFVDTFTKPELEHALRSGRILETYRVALYDESILFKDYVDFFYNARLHFRDVGNPEFAYVSKLLLNCLYGKFGQKQDVYKTLGPTDSVPDGVYKSYDIARGVWEKYRVLDGILERSVGHEEGFDSFVAIASYITAAARALLDGYIQQAGRSEVLYCDTDSLFVTQLGYDRLKDTLDERTLGKLKVEAVSSDVVLYGPKWYQFGDKRKSKGIRKDAEHLGDDRYRQDKFHSFMSTLGPRFENEVIIESIEKKLSHTYKKGTVTPSGKVHPFVLSE